jgi:transposase-like protein
VTEKAQRRTFTAEYKRRIVKEADTCKHAGP